MFSQLATVSTTFCPNQRERETGTDAQAVFCRDAQHKVSSLVAAVFTASSEEQVAAGAVVGEDEEESLTYLVGERGRHNNCTWHKGTCLAVRFLRLRIRKVD